MTAGQQRPASQAPLVEQVKDLLDDSKSAADLLGRLDFDFVEDRDQYAGWHTSTPWRR